MLNRTVKEKLYKILVTPENFLSNNDGLAVINKVWPLRNMPSEDSRYKDAYGDFRQHMVNNEDWELQYAFGDRLELISGPEDKFLRFIEAFVDPEIRKDSDFITGYVRQINDGLSGTGHELRVTNYFEGLPVYKILPSANVEHMPTNIVLNNIMFFKEDAPGITYPCFLLKKNTWDDFGFKTTVELRYVPNSSEYSKLGYTRIMKRDMSGAIWPLLPESFEVLPVDFCSMGNDEEYYLEVKAKFPGNYHSILLALRDAAMFPRISEGFERQSAFRSSLIRENHQEELWRTIRFTMANINYNGAFKFRYDFKPPYSDQSIDLDFNFVYGDDAQIQHRIYALIGKNGAGKTRVLSGIAEQLSAEKPSRIGPLKPLFSKIFTLSYSIFDKFEIQQGNANFNYVYCGLKKNRTEHLTDEELRIRFIVASELIRDRELTDKWYGILNNFIASDILDGLFAYDNGVYAFTPNELALSIERLSSGQHILLYVLTEMLAQIRNNSLILYDEPETHLHPNAISELMNSILALVRDFDSFCIIATHSPLVVQCIQSRNVYVVSRLENDIQLRGMERETFGENLTVITEDIFGNRSIEKDYLSLLRELVDQGMGYEEIVAMFERDNGLPMNLNIRLELKSLFP